MVTKTMFEAVKAKVTTGEIGNVLREVYGEFHPKTII
jgi:methylmalonyl-CoA mutase N-terminal domain/subunit